jgi:hypothetical protein
MEGMPLRSVPARLPGPVNPVHALAQVATTLPDLAADAQRALALVDLGAVSRAAAAAELGCSEAELSQLLAAGRKALRRNAAALPSGGWCERAERLISDRLDGALSPAGQRRLDAHMAGCERCATHERKLIQGHDQLVEDYLSAHTTARPRALAVEAPALHVVGEAAEAAGAEDGRWPVPALAWRVSLTIAVLIVLAIAVLALVGALRVT